MSWPQPTMSVTYCDICGDFLFNGQHRGQVEIWCRAIRETRAVETAAAITEGDAARKEADRNAKNNRVKKPGKNRGVRESRIFEPP